MRCSAASLAGARPGTCRNLVIDQAAPRPAPVERVGAGVEFVRTGTQYLMTAMDVGEVAADHNEFAFDRRFRDEPEEATRARAADLIAIGLR
jgi:hypothetical protein